MNDSFFVDTNVLVYRRDLSARAKQKKAAAWLKALWTHRCGRTSQQVLNEYYHVVTHKLTPGLAASDARAEVGELEAWRPLPLTRQVSHVAWQIEDRHGLSWWDSLIVAAARLSSCTYLLTEDLQDGQDLSGVTVVDPFAHGPDDFES